MRKDTQCVHSGTPVDPGTKGLNKPICTSSSFEYMDAPENVYPRYFNIPNQKSIIDKLCALENAEDGHCLRGDSSRRSCRRRRKSRLGVTETDAGPIMLKI